MPPLLPIWQARPFRPPYLSLFERKREAEELPLTAEDALNVVPKETENITFWSIGCWCRDKKTGVSKISL